MRKLSNNNKGTRPQKAKNDNQMEKMKDKPDKNTQLH